VQRHSSNLKGAVAELKIAAAAAELGVPVLRPMTEHGRYDLAFEVGRRILRVQCKWAARRGEVIAVRLSGYRLSPRGAIKTSYTAHEIDAVAAYCPDVDRTYLLPTTLIAGLCTVHLRLSPPRNGQRAALNWAADYELPGAIAQLEERLSGTQEVAGSSPASSTSPGDDGAEVVGAHEFRNRFGWYLERASRGERFLITRRGGPYAALTPVLKPGVSPAEYGGDDI
jgi:prevent-host-death family protein